MAQTISFALGSVALAHDNRDYDIENVDRNLSYRNIPIITAKESLEEEFNNLFKTYLDDYNNNQKRNDRRINNYYEHIKSGKMHQQCACEYVVQIGNRETNKYGSADTEDTLKIYQEFIKEFQEKLPNLKIINAIIHCDEPDGTPHLHFTIIPMATYDRGLKTRCSLTKALEQCGYTNNKRSNLAVKQFRNDCKNLIASLMKEHNIELAKGSGRKEGVPIAVYKEICGECETLLEDLKAEITHLNERREILSIYENKATEMENKLIQMRSELIKKQSKLQDLDAEIVEKSDKLEIINLYKSVAEDLTRLLYLDDNYDIFKKIRAQMSNKSREMMDKVELQMQDDEFERLEKLKR